VVANEYDYVIAGGGTAGCVLAGLLSRDPQSTVLLVEAGPPDRNPFIHIPAGMARLKGSRLDWRYSTVAQGALGGRQVPYPQGKVIGGCASINAQVYTRGARADYDSWSSEHGCTGWSFDEVLPYFRRSEGNSRLSLPFHGTDGPLGVSDTLDPQPISLAFIKAAQEFGLPYNTDFNGASSYGVGLYQAMTRGGLRCSPAKAYLRPALRRRNLTVKTHCVITRLLLDGAQVTGVEMAEGGKLRTARARREVIVAAGAIGSPKLLQLSGIGDPAHLRSIGTTVRHSLPGVGRNLHDHCNIGVLYELKSAESLDRFNKPTPATAAAGIEYALFRGGPLASTVVEAGGFSCAAGGTDPDIQFAFVAAETGVPVPAGHRVRLHSLCLRPRSRGRVLATSSDPLRPPSIDPNYLVDEYDVEISIAGVRQSREIMAEPSMARHVKAEHSDLDQMATRDDYARFVRRAANLGYHVVGTCAMGHSESSVVSPDLKVRGLGGVRVADASIMPTIVGANTEAAVIMIAEKAADMVLNDAGAVLQGGP
jgi:choline dehydrogenase